jgi:hypothetical protein
MRWSGISGLVRSGRGTAAAFRRSGEGVNLGPQKDRRARQDTRPRGIDAEASMTPLNYLQVFRFVGTAAFNGRSMALRRMTIWYRRSRITARKPAIGGLVYGLRTAGVLGWLWPRWAGANATLSL